ncbi:hypothetical protein SteCoe_33609 [Stentor coeruleus]|uniref:Uncharacterized protein n=1 Tax=Stentor coeruleus TaxID=5963 RepID=A0A1R2AWE0_9CILI|nr:hypothetical protein SteCoe_33609 [Stentor coeruleus]
MAAVAMLREQKSFEEPRLQYHKGFIDDLRTEIREKDQIILNAKLLSDEWQHKNEELVKENSMLRSKLSGMFADQLAAVNEKHYKEIYMQMTEIQRFKKIVMDLEEKLKKCNKVNELNMDIENKNKEYEGQIDVLVKKMQALEEENAKKEKKLEEFVYKIEKFRGKISKEVKNTLKNYEDRFQGYIKEIQELEYKIQTTQDSLALAQIKISEKSESDKNINKYIETVKKFAELEEAYQKLLKKYESEAYLTVNSVKVLEEKISSLENKLKNAEEKNCSLETSEFSLKSLNGKLQEQISILESKTKDYHNQILFYKNKLDKKMIKKAKYTKEIEDFQQELKLKNDIIEAYKLQIANNEQDKTIIFQLQEINKQNILNQNIIEEEIEKYKKQIANLENQLKSKNVNEFTIKNDNPLIAYKNEITKTDLERQVQSENTINTEVKVYKGTVNLILNCVSKIEFSCRNLETDFRCVKCLKVEQIEVLHCGHLCCLSCCKRCSQCAAEVPAFNTSIFYQISRRIYDLNKNTANIRDIIIREIKPC